MEYERQTSSDLVEDLLVLGRALRKIACRCLERKDAPGTVLLSNDGAATLVNLSSAAFFCMYLHYTRRKGNGQRDAR